jgi:CRISPR-associated protein Csm1
MDSRESLYFAALLHDVQRLPGGALPAGHALDGGEAPLGEPAAALLRLADAAVRAPPAPGDDRGEVRRLSSIFSHVAVERGGRTHSAPRPVFLAPRVLSTAREALFPGGEGTDTDARRRLLDGLRREMGATTDVDALYPLLEKYLVTLPSDDGERGVSLFDRARARAALALCLYDELVEGGWRGAEREVTDGAVDGLPPPCLLVSGGLSGIQDFIFDIPSRRASKSLKGRSAHVQFAADVCVRRLLDDLALREASVLYNGGGSFILLAPAARAERLETLRRELGGALLPESLSLALGWAEVSVADLREGRFGARWQAAHAAMQRRKDRRFQELGVQVFAPLRQRPRDEEGEDDPFARLTERLSRAAGYALRAVPPVDDRREGAVERRLGYERRFVNEGEGAATVFNRTDLLGSYGGFRFFVKDLPRYTPDLLERLYPSGELPEGTGPGSLIHFLDLARMAAARTGTEKLGVLKMDVDDLGEIFGRGLPAGRRTIAGVGALSRSLKWFFEGYVSELLGRGTFRAITAEGSTEVEFGTQLYPIFSGGDDFLVVGGWDAVFEFARRVRDEFAAFVDHHPGITLSAALLVVDPKESVVRFAARAEERMERAKLAGPEKDRVSVFDSVLRWRDFAEAAALKEKLEVLVKQRGESQNLLQRVQQSADGHMRYQTAAREGSFRPERIWRLAYFLGRTTHKSNRAQIDEIVELHQKLLLQAFARPQDAPDPALFVVAGRWAELSARQGSQDRPRREPLTV